MASSCIRSIAFSRFAIRASRTTKPSFSVPKVSAGPFCASVARREAICAMSLLPLHSNMAQTCLVSRLSTGNPTSPGICQLPEPL